MVEGFTKRKKYVVDRKFQYRMVASFHLSVLVALSVFTLVISAIYWVDSMAGNNLFKEFITIDRQVIETREVIVDGKPEMREVSYTETESGIKRWEIIIPPLVINNLVIIIGISVLGLRYSHKIAGPAYRIREDIKRVLDDNESVQISLRKGDKLTDLVGEVNRLIREYIALKEKSR